MHATHMVYTDESKEKHSPFRLSKIALLSGGTVASLPHGPNLLQFPTLHERFPTAQVRSHFARVDPVHDHHGEPHDQCIEDVEEVFAHHNVSIVTLRILDHAYNRSYENQHADQVEREHVLLPRSRVALGCWLAADAGVENGGCDDEEAEDNDLHDKTGNDDVGAHVAAVGVVGGSK